MTNREKFIEVFGDNPQRHHITKSWWDEEYVPPKEPKTGRWVEENVNGGGRRVFCSECGCPPPFEHINTGDVYSASGYGIINKTKFCPSCGIRMESEVV